MPGEPWDYPEAQGLYDPSFERAACGVGFIVNIDGIPSPKVNNILTIFSPLMDTLSLERRLV